MAELRPRDLSQAGVFVPSEQALPLDREVSLVLQSPIGELCARGQIVQVVTPERAAEERRRPGFGVLWVHLGDEDRAFIGLTLDALDRRERQQKRAEEEAEQARAAAAKSAPPAKKDERERRETLAELGKQLSSLRDARPWQVLGVSQGASPEEAKRAFLDATKRCHPHVFARFDDAEITAAATELFIVYKRALSKFSNQDKTQTSLRPLAVEPTGPPTVRFGNSLAPRSITPQLRDAPEKAAPRTSLASDTKRVTKNFGPEGR